MEEKLKNFLGPVYDMAVKLGEKLGEALNDSIDECLPPSGKQKNEKGGKYGC